MPLPSPLIIQELLKETSASLQNRIVSLFSDWIRCKLQWNDPSHPAMPCRLSFSINLGEAPYKWDNYNFHYFPSLR